MMDIVVLNEKAVWVSSVPLRCTEATCFIANQILVIN
jgi:hypothetical protein